MANADSTGDRAISPVIFARSCCCSSALRRRTLGRGGLSDQFRRQRIGSPFRLARHLLFQNQYEKSFSSCRLGLPFLASHSASGTSPNPPSALASPNKPCIS